MEGYKLINNELKKFTESMFVDSELSSVSENPVQNKIITGKLNEKADSMIYDEDNSKLKLMNGTTVLSEVTVSGGGSANGATIGVLTSESTLIGKEVVLSKDSATIKTGQFNVSGICTFSGIEDTGTYTVTATDGTDTTSEDVTVTTDDVLNKSVLQVTLTFVPDGATVTPTDDVGILLKCAEVKGTDYTTIAEVLADDSAMYEITAHEESMKYLARSTSFADDICADETFMTYLGSSAYVDATILNSDLWCDAICDSQYFESVLLDLIPHMTSATEPSGEVSYGGNADIHSTCKPYTLFDKIHRTGASWHQGSSEADGYYDCCFWTETAPAFVIYKNTIKTRALFIKIYSTYCIPASVYSPTLIKLYGSNDGESWDELLSKTDLTNTWGDSVLSFHLTNQKKYLYYKIEFSCIGKQWSSLSELYIYGR